MKKLLIALLLLIPHAVSAINYTPEVEQLLCRLDSMISQKALYTAQKESKIVQLSKLRVGVTSPEEQYWLNKQLYDEYFVYNTDSAMVCVNQNMEIARTLGKSEWIQEWKIKKSFLFAVTGLLKEALDELSGLSGNLLPDRLQTEYYEQMRYIYSHFGQYMGENTHVIRDEYAHQENLYKDSLCAVVSSGNPFYLWYRGWKYLGTDSAAAVKEALLDEVPAYKLNSRLEAMNAYILAKLCQFDGETNNYLKFMIYSAMADVCTANKDIASLEELAKVLFQMGDIDRSYAYINYCFLDAQMFRNRVRVVGISEVLDDIQRAYQERNRKQQARLNSFFIQVCILSVVLLVAILYIYRQMRYLANSRHQLNEANSSLNRHIEELSQAHTSLAEVNTQLKTLNDQLKDANEKQKEANEKLRESNYVKEEYIGNVFALCSNYISKLDEYRKNINRKIKAKQFDDVKAMTDNPTMAHNELKEFYHNFDAIFLHVYPDFVNDFNALLQPESRIVLKEGELLNTDLRIYALVRLGINDSVKIAEFLHCSPQTVYNNRLKTRNKAIIPKEEFANTVRSLGKMQE